MPADGSIKFPKVAQPQSQGIAPTQTSTQPPFNPATQSSTTYASQVPTLCIRLGFNIPKYEIRPVIPDSPVYDAWADFGADPRIEGEVGKVMNVHGKKSAKEEVARKVIAFLRDIERQRMEDFDIDDKKRKRSSESIGNEEGAVKTIKP